MFKFKKILIPLTIAIVICATNLSLVSANGTQIHTAKPSTRISTEQGYTLAWESVSWGEALVKVKKGNLDITYAYNDNKNRISKTSGDKTVAFIYNNDSKLISETRGTDSFTYQYDYANSIIGFTLNNVSYNFIKGADFNVIGITDVDNNNIATYEYDEKGMVTAILGKDSAGQWIDKSKDDSFIGTLNQIRLHSYYNDTETGWYYNGYQYYDSANNKYVVGAEISDLIATTMNKNSNKVTPFISQQVAQLVASCVNNHPNSIGTMINYSSTWYTSVTDDVALLARLIYGENTLNSADQNAVAWVLINRKNNGTFGGSTYRSVATYSGAFQPITGGSDDSTKNARVPETSNARWTSAIWDACSLTSTSSSADYSDLIPKPTGISTQLFFAGLNYIFSGTISRDASPTGLEYKMDGVYKGIKDVVIVFDVSTTLQNPSNKAAIESAGLSTYALKESHNIFFNLK